MDTFRGLVELTRPVNAIAAGVLTFIGAYITGNISIYPINASLAVAATVFAISGGNAINDYFDREIDRVNAPERPIPRGAVSPRGALAFSIICFTIAVASALTLPPIAIAIAVINLFALVAYTEWFKGLPGAGNVVVAYLGGSTFLFGGAAVESGELIMVGILAVLAALSTVTREIIKDVEDIAGDRQEGLNTLPIAIGERSSLFLALACIVSAVLASPFPSLLGTFDVVYLAVVLPADVVMLVASMESFRDPTAAQSHMKYGMFLAAAAFIVGRVL